MEEKVPESDAPPVDYNALAKGLLLASMSPMNTEERVPPVEKTIICVICEKTFMSNSNLKRHLRIHTGEKPLECQVCKKRFLRDSTLKTHMRTHTGEKPYECDICKKTFSQQGNLQKHKKLHTGERPYECEVCKKDFIQEVHLKSHMRVHTGERPYECEVCHKRFSQNDLKRHMRVHTGEKLYSCYLCKRNFSRQCYLKTHMRLHSGEKPYECDVCQRRFALKSHVKRHMMLHTNEKPFECHVCKRNFAIKGNLVDHMSIHPSDSSYESGNAGILPSGSYQERSKDTQLARDGESETFNVQEVEVSEGFESGDGSDREEKSHEYSEGCLEDSLSVDDHHTVICNSGRGISHVTSNDMDRGLGDGYSPKSKTENVLYCPEQMVETVFDDNVDCQVKIENSDSPGSGNYGYLEQKQQSQVSRDSDCIENNRVDGNIAEAKRDNDYSNRIMDDNCYSRGNNQLYDFHKVYVTESRNSDNSDANRCYPSDEILDMSKKPSTQSLPLIVKEEPKLL